MTNFWYDYYIDGASDGFGGWVITETIQVSVTGVDNATITNFSYSYKIGEGLWTPYEVFPTFVGGTWNLDTTFHNSSFVGEVSLKADFSVGLKSFTKSIIGDFTSYVIDITSPIPETIYNIYDDGYDSGGIQYCDISLVAQVSGGVPDSVEFQYRVDEGAWAYLADGVQGVGDGAALWSATGTISEADVGTLEIRAIGTFELTRIVTSESVSVLVTDTIEVVVNTPSEGALLLASGSSTMTISTNKAHEGFISDAFMEVYRDGGYVGQYALAYDSTGGTWIYYAGIVTHPAWGAGQVRGKMTVRGTIIYSSYVNVTWLAA